MAAWEEYMTKEDYDLFVRYVVDLQVEMETCVDPDRMRDLKRMTGPKALGEKFEIPMDVARKIKDCYYSEGERPLPKMQPDNHRGLNVPEYKIGPLSRVMISSRWDLSLQLADGAL